MTLAAILIQSHFRSFHEKRKFQQSRRAAVLIQQYYRSYRHSLRYRADTRQVSFWRHFFLPPSCTRQQQPPNEKTEPGRSQNPEIPASMPPQVRCSPRHTAPQTRPRTHKHTHYLHAHMQPTVACPRYTGANSWCCFTVPVKPLDGP